MDQYCDHCYYLGDAEAVDETTTLEACQGACLADDTCYAITFWTTGSTNSTDPVCMLNRQPIPAFEVKDDYNSFIKVCGGKNLRNK